MHAITDIHPECVFGLAVLTEHPMRVDCSRDGLGRALAGISEGPGPAPYALHLENMDVALDGERVPRDGGGRGPSR